MKRMAILVLGIALLVLGGIGVAHAPGSAPKNQPESGKGAGTYEPMDDYFDYIEEHKAKNEDTQPLNPPVFRESELLYDNDDCFLLGWDANYLDKVNVRFDLTPRILTVFPNDAIRERDDGTVYFVYGTDSGARLYLIFRKDNKYMTPAGYPLLVKDVLTHDAYRSLLTGDSITAVEKIDPITTYYRQVYEKMDVGFIKGYIKDGAGPASIHLLADGILRVTYGIDDQDNLVISDITYDPDYELAGVSGIQVNYRIDEIDLP